MRKIALLAISAVAILFVVSLVIFWLQGNLFFRLYNVTITVNGMTSDRNQIYKAGNGDYLVFVEDENGKTENYIVSSEREEVGMPSIGIPNRVDSRTIKTDWFVFACYTEPIAARSAVAGTEKFDRNAKISFCPKEISFQIYDRSVVIKF